MKNYQKQLDYIISECGWGSVTEICQELIDEGETINEKLRKIKAFIDERWDKKWKNENYVLTTIRNILKGRNGN